jgi:hypothetical protein
LTARARQKASGNLPNEKVIYSKCVQVWTSLFLASNSFPLAWLERGLEFYINILSARAVGEKDEAREGGHGLPRAIREVGITELICVEPDFADVQWGEDFRKVRVLLEETGVKVRFRKF